MAPQRPSDRVTPTAGAPPHTGMRVGGAVHCISCGYDCVCEERRTSGSSCGSGTDATMPTTTSGVWVERDSPVPMMSERTSVTERPVRSVEAGLVGQSRPVTPLYSAMPLDHLHLMALFVFFYPDASPDAISAYLHEQTGGARWYSREEILDVLYPFSQRNIRRWVFTTQPPPCGLASVRRRQLLDVAEFGIAFVKVSPATTTAATTMVRSQDDGSDGASDATSPNDCTYDTLLVQKPWCYGPSTSIVVLLGVEAGDPNVPDHEPGSVARPRLWFNLVSPSNHFACGSTVVLANFVRFICQCLVDRPAPGGSDAGRVITWDDHHTRNHAMIYDAVRSVTASGIDTENLEGFPPGFHECPLVGIPRPLSHPGRGPAKRCLLDAIDAIVRRPRHHEQSTNPCHWDVEEWTRKLQHVLSSDLSWDGNALRWFDQYPDD